MGHFAYKLETKTQIVTFTANVYCIFKCTTETQKKTKDASKLFTYCGSLLNTLVPKLYVFAGYCTQ